jgi:hypothetical protein
MSSVQAVPKLPLYGTVGKNPEIKLVIDFAYFAFVSREK